MVSVVFLSSWVLVFYIKMIPLAVLRDSVYSGTFYYMGLFHSDWENLFSRFDCY